MKVTAHAVIHRPMEAVFASVSRIDLHLPTSQPEDKEHVVTRFFGFEISLSSRTAQVTEIRKLSAGPVGLGTKYLQITEDNGVSSEDTIEITEYESPTRVAYRMSIGRLPQVMIKFWFILSPVAAGTMVTARVELNGGCYAVLSPFLRPGIKRQMTAALNKLNEETQEV